MSDGFDKHGKKQKRGNPNWKLGQSGNPKGRPKKEACITSILKEQLGQPCPYAEGKTWAEWLARRALELASKNPTYFAALLERVEGKVPQAVNAQIGTQEEVQVHFIIGKGYVGMDGDESEGRREGKE